MTSQRGTSASPTEIYRPTGCGRSLSSNAKLTRERDVPWPMGEKKLCLSLTACVCGEMKYTRTRTHLRPSQAGAILCCARKPMQLQAHQAAQTEATSCVWCARAARQEGAADTLSERKADQLGPEKRCFVLRREAGLMSTRPAHLSAAVEHAHLATSLCTQILSLLTPVGGRGRKFFVCKARPNTPTCDYSLCSTNAQVRRDM